MRKLWKKDLWQRFPWGIFLCTGLLTIISLLFIDSASYDSSWGTTLPYAKRQISRLIPSMFLFLLLALVPLRKTQERAWTFYLIGILLLFAVFFLGRSAKGAARWIPVGPIRIQPSEFMKLFLLLGLSSYLCRRDVTTLKSLVVPFILTLFPLFLVLKQPDLGTSLLFLPLLFSLLYIRGTPLRYLLMIGLCLILCGVAAWEIGGINKYQKDRVYAFLYPAKYENTIAYQQIQSQIAIGSGGFWGKGLYKGSQTQLNFLPERHTDFIFAVICEEWGFLGGIVVLVLLFLLVSLILEISNRCEDEFGKLLALGVGLLIGVQSFINLGIALGILPVTGLTLPFVSYGGSSTLMLWMALGVVAQAAMAGK